MDRIQRLVERRLTEASRAVGHWLPVRWDLGHYEHFKSKRGYGVTFTNPGEPCHIRLSTKMERSPIHRIDGVLRHEIGHVVDHLFPKRDLNEWGKTRGVKLSSTMERRADDIAHAIWGSPIRYDGDTVQSTRVGVWPRPAHLGL